MMMRYIQAGALVVAGALGGVLIMKMTSPEPRPAPVEQAVNVPPPPAVTPLPVEPPSVVTPPAPEPEKKPVRTHPVRRARTQPKEEAPKPVVQPDPPAAPEPPKTDPVVNPPRPEAKPEPIAKAEPPIPVPPPPPRRVTVPQGTLIPIRMNETVSSAKNSSGDSFTGSLTEELVVDGLVIAERGAPVEGRIIQTQQAGRVKGLSLIELELTQLNTSDGQRVEIRTDSFSKEGQSSTKEDAAKIGIGAAIGAAIGAIAGGGKGAAIGAGVGGAAGTGGVIATRGKSSEIAAETKISFRLSEPVTLTEQKRTARRN